MKRKKKIYISLPISGKPIDLVKLRLKELKAIIKKNNTPVSPLDLTEDSDDYATCIGKDIAGLLKCDGVYFAKGWENSKGCQAEYAVARIYGLEIFFE